MRIFLGLFDSLFHFLFQFGRSGDEFGVVRIEGKGDIDEVRAEIFNDYFAAADYYSGVVDAACVFEDIVDVFHGKSFVDAHFAVLCLVTCAMRCMFGI